MSRHRRGGPNTSRGKDRCRRNAYRHGLAALLLLPDRSERQQQLSAHFSQDEKSENRTSNEAASARVRLEEVLSVRTSVVRLARNERLSQQAGKSDLSEAEGVMNSIQCLKRLARYERRALTQWFRSLERLQEGGAELEVVERAERTLRGAYRLCPSAFAGRNGS